jgi:hypothetical protein
LRGRARCSSAQSFLSPWSPPGPQRSPSHYPRPCHGLRQGELRFLSRSRQRVWRSAAALVGSYPGSTPPGKVFSCGQVKSHRQSLRRPPASPLPFQPRLGQRRRSLARRRRCQASSHHRRQFHPSPFRRPGRATCKPRPSTPMCRQRPSPRLARQSLARFPTRSRRQSSVRRWRSHQPPWPGRQWSRSHNRSRQSGRCRSVKTTSAYRRIA